MEGILSNMLLLAISATISVLAFFLKRLLNRINRLEEEQHHLVTENEVRQIVSDKVDPIKERLTRIEAGIDNITRLLMK